MKRLLKNIWTKSDWLRNNVSWLLKMLNLKPSVSFQTKLSYTGVFTVKTSGNRSFLMQGTNLGIENKVFWSGLYDREGTTITTFEKYARRADWIIDVGANTGVYSLLGKTVNPKAKVAAFEPVPFFYNLLAENIKKNNYEIVHRQQAASNEKGSQAFYVATAYQGNIYSSTLERGHFAAHQSTAPQTITVETVTLSSFLEEVAWQGKGLIKIDAEGHDIEVITGLGDYIISSNILPVLIVEIKDEEMAKRLKNLPFMNQYKCFGINDKTDKLTPALSGPNDKDCDNYLFLPTQWETVLNN